MKSQAPGHSLLRRLAVVAGAVALVGAAACAAQVDQDAPQPEVTAKEHHRHRSPVKVVIDATLLHGDLTLEQEQTIDTIAAELEERRQSWRGLHDKLKSSAVDVVRSGSADSEAFDRSVAEAVDAVEEYVQQSSDALEEIHAILEPDQRASVAEALRARIDEKFGPKPAKEKHRRDGFKRFVSHLALSSLQVDQLMAIKKELIGDKRELRPDREELYALVDAFEGDHFRAALDEFHAKKSKILRARVARAGERTDTVLSIFTPEQRELLADLILEGPRKVLFGEEGEPASHP
jgi:Spy/CpxP family protein refolding chaperone